MYAFEIVVLLLPSTFVLVRHVLDIFRRRPMPTNYSRPPVMYGVCCTFVGSPSRRLLRNVRLVPPKAPPPLRVPLRPCFFLHLIP